jgi:polyphosphate kinase
MQLINKLYEASQAGVKIDLIIRSICCLRPGLPGLSENIRVRSIVGRFLEHTRVYYFSNNGDARIYCSSADWMDRNLFNRVEACFLIEDPVLKKRIYQQGLVNYLKITSKRGCCKGMEHGCVLNSLKVRNLIMHSKLYWKFLSKLNLNPKRIE